MLIKSSKRKFGKFYRSTLQDEEQQQQNKLYQKVTRAFTEGCLRPSQHRKLIGTINQRVQRPNTAYNTKNSFIDLKNLVNCNQNLYRNRNHNIKRLKSLKQITCSKENQQKFYHPLNSEIKKTQGHLKKKKSQKYNQQKLKTYYHRKISEKQCKQVEQQKIHSQKTITNLSFDKIVGLILDKGMKKVKNYLLKYSCFHHKLKMFGEQYAQQNKQALTQQATQFINKQSRGKQISPNSISYMLNHFLLQKLMIQILYNTEILHQKSANRNIYNNIKQEMVSELIDQNKFVQILGIITNFDPKQAQKNDVKQQQVSVIEIKRQRRMQQRRKNNRTKTFQSSVFNARNKQNEISKQFQYVFELTQNRIKQAENNYRIPVKQKNVFQSLIQMSTLADQSKC